jgi:hypothetical protein
MPLRLACQASNARSFVPSATLALRPRCRQHASAHHCGGARSFASPAGAPAVRCGCGGGTQVAAGAQQPASADRDRRMKTMECGSCYAILRALRPHLPIRRPPRADSDLPHAPPTPAPTRTRVHVGPRNSRYDDCSNCFFDKWNTRTHRFKLIDNCFCVTARCQRDTMRYGDLGRTRCHRS